MAWGWKSLFLLLIESNTQNLDGPLRVWVVSDLHLFARRSVAVDCFASVRERLAGADVLVLNGDTFDFRWSTLPDIDATVTASIAWLRKLCTDFPGCEVHFVLGNHDCPTFFRSGLATLADVLPRFHWHEYGVRVGSALFVHGDCTHRKMDTTGLSRYRQSWDNDYRHAPWRAKAYVAADHMGFTWFTHKGWFPRRQTVNRLVHYLDRACPGWRQTTRDCYFGHTHLPFSHYVRDGIAFHNTGSAIRGMGFNPIVFTATAAQAETLNVAGQTVRRS